MTTVATVPDRRADRTPGGRPDGTAAVFRWATGDPRVWVGGCLLALIGLFALLAPIIAPFDPLAIRPAQALGSAGSGPNLLGTDEFGRDILSRILYGARSSLVVMLAATALSGALGTALGVVAAFRGGVVDGVIMRAMDLILAFPAVVLAIAVIAFLGNNVANLIVTIAGLVTPSVARTAYASALTVRNLEFMEAARAIGASDLRQMRLGILPNIAAPLIVRVTLNAGLIVLVESGLGFLGLGAPPPAPTLGGMVADARPYLELQPGYALWPSVALALTILAINVFGDGLRDRLDPRLRRR